MGEFTQTPEYTPRLHMQSDSEPKDVSPDVTAGTETETGTETDTAAQGAASGDKTGAEAAQDQGTQTSQQTSADAEGVDKKPEGSTETDKTVEEPKKQYDTDVKGVKSDDQVRVGTDKFPCFDVSQNDFYQNMQDGRRRLRFAKGSNCQKYMQGTKYNRPFFIRHTDDRGKTYVRKIK